MEIDINYLSVRRMRSEQVTNECGDVVLNVAPKLHMAEREFRLRIISTSPTPLFCRTSTVAHCTRLRFVHQIHGDTRIQNLKKNPFGYGVYTILGQWASKWAHMQHVYEKN